MKTVQSATLDGFEALRVYVEASFTKALPAFSIVGLGNTAIQESKDRIKAALIANNFKFPPLKITVNLSPSEASKSGSHFDLPIALLIALQNESILFDDYFVFGELGLDGAIKDTSSIFVLILSLLKKNQIQKVVIPKQSVAKIATLPNIMIYAVESLQDAIEFFRTEEKSSYLVANNQKIMGECIDIGAKHYFFENNFEFDFLDVKGQLVAKRAALIAAAGNHNLLLEGSPGCGKSMIAKRIRFVMPPMSIEEILEKAKLEALDAKEPTFRPLRMFRSPHHSSTKASIFGGGAASAKIGEIAIASNGVIFFDELPHFSKTVLEAMREPLEDHKILISRVNSKIEYKTKFLFVAAMNPCPCGNLLSSTKECRCNELEIKRYKNRLSDPFLDRIDLYVQMAAINKEDAPTLSSSQMQQKVLKAFVMQKSRLQEEFNGKLEDKDIQKYCSIDLQTQEILDKAITTFSLSLRSVNKILKVSRTIADLDESPCITKNHLLEALSFRRR